MERKATWTQKVVAGVSIGILIVLALTVVVRFGTRQILIEHFGIDNTFTEFVWYDNSSMWKANKDTDAESDDDSEEISSKKDEIDWEKLYPFDNSKSELDIQQEEPDEKNNSLLSGKIESLTKAVTNVENKIENYATDKLLFYSKIVEYANAYEHTVRWNFVPYSEYNGVIKLSDGYLSGYIGKSDATSHYNALAELNDFCKNIGTDFLYVQAPYKISEYDDTDVSGLLDFSNQNANDLIDMLREDEIDYYDIRETIHENNIYNHDLFYMTDHHWLTTTGLWAAQNILSYCNEKYGWNADLSKLDSEKFNYITYKDWFLGSQGKKVTLSQCEPDDFTLIYPKYETRFQYYVAARGINAVSDYSIVYNMDQIEERDYYGKNPYGGCNYGDQPLIRIENQLTADKHKILIIHDSFGDCLISCLALAEKNIDSIDLRKFTGSVKTYIEETSPDLVIVMYNAGSAAGEIDYTTHTDEFDFR